MGELCTLGPLSINMRFMDTGRHHKPHVHAKCNEFSASVAVDGELLGRGVPSRRSKEVCEMFVEDDICYAESGRASLKIVNAENLPNFRIKVIFNDGMEGVFDGHALKGEVFEPILKDEVAFRNWKLDYETLTWPECEADIAPEFVYDYCVSSMKEAA